MRVLAIETSCDETAASVVEATQDTGRGTRYTRVRVLSNVVSSQADLHARTGGVVPEVAARAHVEAVTFVVDEALKQAAGSNATKSYKLKARSSLDAVAATTEPGLRPALVIGEAAARALATAWGKPFTPVHHIAGHIAAAWLVSDVRQVAAHRFPAVVLVVSGGHTQLWKLTPRQTAIMDDSSSAEGEDAQTWDLRMLGQTRDDAAGEAFDKIARLLGLSYPGGAALARLAEEGDACKFSFPRPMLDSGDDDFSFSGLKTAVYYTIRDLPATSYQLQARQRADLAAAVQEAIVDVLVAKTVEAAAREGAAEVILTGGVAANGRLRTRMQEALGNLPLIVPPPVYCTDNAAMIGAAAVLGIRVPGRTEELRVR